MSMNQLSKIILLFLVLICFDSTAQHLVRADVMPNSSSSELEIDSLKQETFDNNAVVVNGLRFELLIPERNWIIPAQGTHSTDSLIPTSETVPTSTSTPVSIALRIINQTHLPIRLPFSRVSPIIHPPLSIEDNSIEDDSVLHMTVRRENGSFLRGEVTVFRVGVRPLDESCPVIQPGESLIRTIPASLELLENNRVRLITYIGLDAPLQFEVPSSGQYQVQVNYRNLTSSAECYILSPIRVPGVQQTIPAFVTDLWTGEVNLPPIEINIRH